MTDVMSASTRDRFLQDIEMFLARTGMSPTAFGERAMSDRGFVFDLRKGRDIRASAIDRAYAFMSSPDFKPRKSSRCTKAA